MTTQTTPAIQDYLKSLFTFEWDDVDSEGHHDRLVPTTAIAGRLDVSAASATNMLKKLDAMGLVTHVPYRGAGLTEAGRKVALEVIRHHRLLETYLAEALGVPWDEVHGEAEILEHVLSEDLEERIAARLGNPTADPHGHPIPSKDLTMPEPSGRPLWQAADGERVSVERVSDSDGRALRYLAGLGIRPGVLLEVVERGPIGGPLWLRVAGTRNKQAVSKELAEVVWVE
jgi:DtxR family transcriptional regulator, Mn-dependent transcriptional regulator